MYMVWPIEALARKQGEKELAKEPTDIGSKPNRLLLDRRRAGCPS